MWRWLKQQWCGLSRGHYAVVKDKMPYYHTVILVLWCSDCEAPLGRLTVTMDEMRELLEED